MIPLLQATEPANFQATVRQPGLLFLAKVPNPTDEQWKGKEYWQKSLSDMKSNYNSICSYSSCWIPHSTGCHSIDHFVPKAVDPNRAYEWSNFRYVSIRFNSRKGVKSIVDPFQMTFHWFTIDFTSFFIKANIAALDANQLLLARNTIDILKLNDDDELIKERQGYFNDYKQNHIDIHYLKRRVPFIAYEMERQNLL